MTPTCGLCYLQECRCAGAPILDLPWPPSINRYWIRARNGGLFVSARGVEYKRLVHAIASRSFPEPLVGRVQIIGQCFPPDRRRRDLDNIQKCLLDSLEKCAYENDNQIDRIILERCDIVPPGLVRVGIYSLEG